MNSRTKIIIEILKRPAEYSAERVSRALAEVLEVTGGYYLPGINASNTYAAGGEVNGQ